MDNFEIFENDVIKAILTDEDNEFAPILLEQYKNSSVIRRAFTGVGFYTNFKLNNKSLKLEIDEQLRLENIHAEIDGLKYGAGFILWIENGVIDCLEGYSHGEDGWIEDITHYKLSKINSDGSLTELRAFTK